MVDAVASCVAVVYSDWAGPGFGHLDFEQSLFSRLWFDIARMRNVPPTPRPTTPTAPITRASVLRVLGPDDGATNDGGTTADGGPRTTLSRRSWSPSRTTSFFSTGGCPAASNVNVWGPGSMESGRPSSLVASGAPSSETFTS